LLLHSSCYCYSPRLSVNPPSSFHLGPASSLTFSPITTSSTLLRGPLHQNFPYLSTSNLSFHPYIHLSGLIPLLLVMPRAHSPPRRSSRAKPTTSSAQPPSQSSSSTTSSVSARNDRSTRSIGKHENSATPQSRNSEEASSQQRSTTLGSGGGVATTSASAPTTATDLVPSTRRSGRRAQEDSRKDTTDMPHDEDEIIEDEETTRCVCGFQDYPGPPVDVSTTTITTSTTITTTTTTPPSSSFSLHRGSKAGLAPPSDPDTQTEEPGSLFIQCDTCEVWQHGGCVGIMTESATPENYFCEQCRPEFHRLMKTLTG
jgi:PHD-finger